MISMTTAHLWQSSLFAAVAGLLTLLLKRNRARTRYWIWLAGLVKFLVPFGLLVSLGGHISLPRWTPKAPAIVESAISSVMGDVAQPALTTALAVPKNTSDHLPEALLGLWACGFVAIVFCWGRRWTRIHADVRMAARLPIKIGIPVVSSPVLREPGVFGIFRPVLLLPEGMAQHLTKEEWEAILAHELCHVRCYDNLTAVVYMLVESIFWFHPLVWWMGARLVAERERACDEEVLRLGSEPKVYAEGILKVCELYLESPLECVAGVTGSNLRRRIRAIMTHRGTERMSMGKKLVLAAAGISAVALPIAIGIMNPSPIRAQPESQAARPVFDVASIRLSNSKSGGPVFAQLMPGSLAYQDRPLAEYVWVAYDVKPYQVTHAPAVSLAERYDIIAKAAGPVPESQVKLMLRSLLEDRFKLALHRETKELPAYILTVDKGGPRFKASADKGPRDAGTKDGDLQYRRTSMAYLVGAVLSNLPSLDGTPVVDRTGLDGIYDFSWKLFDPDAAKGEADRKGDLLQQMDNGLNASMKALGLKLKSQKASIEFLVIDHVERPTEN